MSDCEEKYRDALKKCSIRYATMINDYLDNCIYWGDQSQNMRNILELRDFIRQYHNGIDSLPLMKLNRWLGYIQGSLIQLKITTVEAERDWTRPLFRPLDFGDENGRN